MWDIKRPHYQVATELSNWDPSTPKGSKENCGVVRSKAGLCHDIASEYLACRRSYSSGSGNVDLGERGPVATNLKCPQPGSMPVRSLDVTPTHTMTESTHVARTYP